VYAEIVDSLCPQPVELLHKSLEDTQKELKDSGLNYYEIYERYSERESQRQGKQYIL